MFSLYLHWLCRWYSGKESTCQGRRHKRHGFDPWVGKIPWRRKWQPTPAFLSGKSHEQRSLAGYSPWSRKRMGHSLAAKQQADKRSCRLKGIKDKRSCRLMPGPANWRLPSLCHSDGHLQISKWSQGPFLPPLRFTPLVKLLGHAWAHLQLHGMQERPPTRGFVFIWDTASS